MQEKHSDAFLEGTAMKENPYSDLPFTMQPGNGESLEVVIATSACSARDPALVATYPTGPVGHQGGEPPADIGEINPHA